MLEALTVHRRGLSTAAYGIHAAFVGISMRIVAPIPAGDPGIPAGIDAGIPTGMDAGIPAGIDAGIDPCILAAEPAPAHTASALTPTITIKNRATQRRSVKPRCTGFPF
jgi:hypothetical protein